VSRITAILCRVVPRLQTALVALSLALTFSCGGGGGNLGGDSEPAPPEVINQGVQIPPDTGANEPVVTIDDPAGDQNSPVTEELPSPPIVLDWDEPAYPHRVTITLNPHPARDRLDVPVIVSLSHADAHILHNVRIYEVTDGGTVPIAGGAWSQPDGSVLEVSFTAHGVTARGTSRTFYVYYQTGVAPDGWSWTASNWADGQILDRDGDLVKDGFRLASDECHRARSLRDRWDDQVVVAQ
jgi:hypothetical protein